MRNTGWTHVGTFVVEGPSPGVLLPESYADERPAASELKIRIFNGGTGVVSVVTTDQVEDPEADPAVPALPTTNEGLSTMLVDVGSTEEFELSSRDRYVGFLSVDPGTGAPDLDLRLDVFLR
jgi:hypothetical protein